MQRQDWQDRAAILATIECYFAAIDCADKALLARCFTIDARYESAGGTLDLTGRDLIAARLASGRFPATTHVRGNSVVTVTAASAEADTRAVAILAEQPDGSGRIMLRGLRYIDRLTETDGTWLISHRQHLTLWQSDLAAVPAFVP